MDKIKVLLIDDDNDWLESLKLFLSSFDYIEVTGTVRNSEELEEFKSHPNNVDIIILDNQFNNDISLGIYITAELSQYNNKIIILSSLDDEKTILDSFTAGAANYILKAQYRQIPYIIKLMANKNSPIEILANNFAKQQEEKMLNTLTLSEKEILALIQDGHSQTEIAEILCKSKGTLRCQINKIIKKMGVKSSKEAARKVSLRGFYK